MKFNISHRSLIRIYRLILFLSTVTILVQFFPTQDRFKYQFEVGRPWTYELITASFDFPIYKNDQLIESERTELLKDLTPYFILDSTVFRTQLHKFQQDLRHYQHPNKHIYLSVVTERLKKIYKSGIISVSDYNMLLADGTRSIACVQPNRMTHLTDIAEVYTPKIAYEELLKGTSDTFKSLNLNFYVTPNLNFDEEMTTMSKNELFKNLPLTSGMIQSGERIIDRGELVTPAKYQILKSLKIEIEKRRGTLRQSVIVIVGELLMDVFLVGLFFVYLMLFRPRLFHNFSHLFFVMMLIVIMVALTYFLINYTTISYYVLPFGMLPIIIRVFFDSRTALFAHWITTLLIAFLVDNSFQFLLLQVTIGMVAVSSLKDMTQRSQLAQTALYIFISYLAMFFAYEFFSEGDLERVHLQPVFWFAISSVFLLFAYLLIYIFEKIFNLLSSITLVELTNINSDLMMKFSELAPGTFQHTLQVSNLVTEAARKINANTLLVRTGALYHDIGKMLHPECYIENQMGGENPLLNIDPKEAAAMIISHVTDGVDLAKKNRLPEQIINFIVTHHGKTKAKYFYNTYVNQYPDELLDETSFLYPGPLPNTKETAILMMADAVEARSRSLSVYTEESINEMVESMIDSQIADGQFKDAPITFRDVETVKEVFKNKIKNIYHTRIAYPEAIKKNTK